MRTKEPLTMNRRWSVDEAYKKMNPLQKNDDSVQEEMKRLLSRRALNSLTSEEWNRIYDATKLILQVRNRMKSRS